MNFWQTLKKPIFVLAPMADVTDASFRRVIAKYGKPDVIWTEFVSADGLAHADAIGRGKLMRDLIYIEAERPIVAQFFTAKPENMYKAAVLARELGFDGIDINMGCPDKGIERQGAGAAMIKNPRLAREVIRAAKEGAKGLVRQPDGSLKPGELPVSVKTRIGFNKIEVDTWLPELLTETPAVITIHARTRKEMSKVPAQWEQVKRAVEIRNELQKNLRDKNTGEYPTLIFGNGDALDLADARAKAVATGADGVMLGRAIFGNPWLFAVDGRGAHVNGQNAAGILPEEKLRVLVEHTQLYEELLGDIKNFAIMKKHFKAYVSGWDGAKELRGTLMEAGSAAEVAGIVDNYLKGRRL